MIKKAEFETIVNEIKSKLDETSGALVSEELLSTLSHYSSSVDEYEELLKENESLKKDKDDLLKVNGRLYQKIGFDKPEEKEKEKKKEREELSVEDIINEKGEFI